MVKYIDADLLRKEIEVQRDLFIGHAAILKKTVATDGFDVVLRVIDSLQQEQSCDTCTNDKGCVTCKDGELWEGKEQPCKDLEEGYKDKDWGILQDMSIGEEED